MRKTILGLAAAAVAVMAGTTSASAWCGHDYGCALNHTGYGSYGYAGVAPYEKLPLPTGRYRPGPKVSEPQYYYVNQGPTFSGPGDFAPYPTYQETAVRGWTGYERGYDYPYDGGPYGNATNHFSDIAPSWQGPMITSYRWNRHGHPRVQRFGIFPQSRTATARRASGYRMAGPGVVYAPRFNVVRPQ